MRVVLITLAAAALLAYVVPLFADLYLYSIVITVLIWVMFGQAWNLLGGYTGQISFGHAMFLGVGAYSAMLVVNLSGLDMFPALLLAGLLAGLLSVPIGLLIFRLQGPYFALSTLAIAEILHIVARNWKSVTNGGEGLMLSGVPTFLGLRIFGKSDYFFLGLGLCVLMVLFCHALIRTRSGYAFIAIRENQESAEAMGINSVRVKSLALFTSAFLAGVAGGFYGLYNKFIDPEMTLTVHMSAQMLFVTIIGGIGTIAGPIIGAMALVALQEYLKTVPFLQAYASLYLIVYGITIMLVITYLPGGIVEGARKLAARLRRKP